MQTHTHTEPTDTFGIAWYNTWYCFFFFFTSCNLQPDWLEDEKKHLRSISAFLNSQLWKLHCDNK